MKIKDGYVLRDVAGQAVVIAVGEASRTFHGMISLNATGKQIWQGVSRGLRAEAIAQELSEEYEVDPEKALRDTNEMIEKMRAAGVLEE